MNTPSPDRPQPPRDLSSRRPKRTVFLATQDDALWPQVGAALGIDSNLKHVDSIDELMESIPAGQSAVVVWDARRDDDPAASLAKLQSHTGHFAIVALDEPAAANAWKSRQSQRKVAAFATLPLAGDALAEAIQAADADIDGRMVLLGDGGSGSAAPPRAPRRGALLAAGIGVALLAAIAAFFMLRHRAADVQAPLAAPAAATSPAPAPTGAADAAAPAATKSALDHDEKLYGLLESARQAMMERHYIDPAAGSALSLYNDALIFDPSNGEAQQGLQRIEEILVSRIQSALDEHKFDVALRSLETARSIDPKDPRLAAFDVRITSVRSELGLPQIQAAISAQNYDRADQLLDEAARARTLSDARVAQLHEQVAGLRKTANIDRLEKLFDARLQQDKLSEPKSDSASYYLEEARKAGASADSLQARSQELARRLHASQTQSARPPSGAPSLLELAQTRLAQGKLLEPDSDNALTYAVQLRAADPQNPALPQISAQIQSQILAAAASALDAGNADEADVMLQQAKRLGTSAETGALGAKIDAAKHSRDDAPAIPDVPPSQLQALAPLKLDYPQNALNDGTEGWVDIAFQVGVDGKVSSVTVLAAKPAGVFDAAARDAMLRARYRPFMRGGHPVAVNSKMRVSFHMATR